jgi:6-phosphogluconolactonase (cycloisomerase 2 family)
LSVTLALGAMSGCGGGSARKILYAVGLSSPSVTIFAVSSSGELSVAADSVSTGSTPNAIGIDPQLRFAYVVDSAGSSPNGGVSQYTINASSGALTVATIPASGGATSPAIPVPTGANPSGIAIDGGSTFAFVANQDSNKPSISVYTIDSVGGALTEVRQQSTCVSTDLICPFLIAVPPSGIVVSGSFLFISTQTGAPCPQNASINCTLWVYSFDSKGALKFSSASPFSGASPATASLTALATDPSGKFLFVTDKDSNTVAAFSIGSSGQLTAVGSPVPAGTRPVSARVDPSGKFLYTANQGSNDVSAFSIDSSGTLAPLSNSSVLPGTSPSYIVTDTSGRFLFVANRDSNNISVFSIDNAGALKPVTSSPFASVVVKPVALASIH